MPSSVTFTVPLVPDSVNTYTRHSGGRHYKSKRATAFENAFPLFCRNLQVVGEKFAVSIIVYVGPKQHPDVDNLAKQPLDCLALAGLLVNRKGEVISDNHVRKMSIERNDEQRDNPRTEITVTAL